MKDKEHKKYDKIHKNENSITKNKKNSQEDLVTDKNSTKIPCKFKGRIQHEVNVTERKREAHGTGT